MIFWGIEKVSLLKKRGYLSSPILSFSAKLKQAPVIYGNTIV